MSIFYYFTEYSLLKGHLSTKR